MGQVSCGLEHEGGGLRAWLPDALSRSLAAVANGESSASQLIAGAGVDVRNRLHLHLGSVPGSGNMHTDVKFLLADRANGRVWSGGAFAVVLW